jgi:DDE superfamily endonuclease
LEKKLEFEVKQIQANYPEAQVELWCEDEHRVGLKPILKRVYVPEGENPIAQVNWRYQWLWLYAFVQPQSGETYWWILPYVNIDLFTKVLAEFAKEFGIGKHKRVLLVLDQAGWHKSVKVVIPEGIHLLPFPSHSPELQPAERLWTILDQPVANRTFGTLDELELILLKSCQSLMKQKELVRGLTNFHWWYQI